MFELSRQHLKMGLAEIIWAVSVGREEKCSAVLGTERAQRKEDMPTLPLSDVELI